MKVIKALIWVLIILAIIITVIMIFNSKNNNNNNIVIVNNIKNNAVQDNVIYYSIQEDEGIIEEYKAFQRVGDRNTFFSIEKFIKQYFIYLKVGNANAAYDILDDSYINEQGISQENVLDIARLNVVYDGAYSLKEVYVKNLSKKCIYYAKGTLEKDLSKTNMYCIMYYDISNKTYSIKPITAELYSAYITEKLSEDKMENITQTKYNNFKTVIISDEEMAGKYLLSYIECASNYPKEAYKLLDEEYRKAKFGSYENFVEYLTKHCTELNTLYSNNKKTRDDFASDEEYSLYIMSLNSVDISKYDTYIKDNIIYYECIDTYNNYYVFKISTVMDYTVMLDTYTIDTPSFVESYEAADIQEKMEMNINKIFEAINNQDYKYVYNKLEASYKQATFASYSNFEKLMKSNFFEQNSVEFDDYDEDEGSYNLIITDATESNTKELECKIIMQLGDNTDYAIKFE